MALWSLTKQGSRKKANSGMKLLIVEDDPPARAAIHRLCQQHDGVHVIGEAGSGAAAINAVERLRPDVMLIDVELPDMTGFDVLRGLPTVSRPFGIMVATHADCAVAAFAAGALDYLVKPLSAERFAESIERARQLCASTSTRSDRVRAIREPQPAPAIHAPPTPSPKLLIGEREHRLYPLNAENIDYIESDGNYVTIRTGNSKYISRDTIKRLSVDLADVGFLRIERSLLVNIGAVSYVESVGRGTFAFTLSSGSCLHSSASYRDSILRALPMRRLSTRRVAR